MGDRHRFPIATIERLWGAEVNTPEGDTLDILLTLVEAYENQHHPIDPPDPIEAIKFRMEQMGLSRKDLEPYIGKRGRVSEVLNRQRALSLNIIRRLHTHLHIPLVLAILESLGMWPLYWILYATNLESIRGLRTNN